MIRPPAARDRRTLTEHADRTPGGSTLSRDQHPHVAARGLSRVVMSDTPIHRIIEPPPVILPAESRLGRIPPPVEKRQPD